MQTKKTKTPSTNDGFSTDDSSLTPNTTNSGIELVQCESNSVNSCPQDNSEIDIEQEKGKDGESSSLWSDLDTDSEYDANSDTELLENLKRMKYDSFCSRLREQKKSCLRVFSLAKLARKVKQRVTECIGCFTLCVVGMWKFNYSRCCKHLSVKRRFSMEWRSVARGALKTVLLLRDRKVSISIGLYGLTAFICIIVNEVPIHTPFVVSLKLNLSSRNNSIWSFSGISIFCCCFYSISCSLYCW